MEEEGEVTFAGASVLTRLLEQLELGVRLPA
jgi:hypothetical protein